MTVTRFGPTIQRLRSGAIGYDPDAETGDVPDPVDLALEAIIETPTPGGDAVLLQQTSDTQSGSNLFLTLADAPAVGSVLFTAMTCGVGGGTIPAGFTLLDTLDYRGSAERPLIAAYRVVQPGDGTTYQWTSVASRPVGVLLELGTASAPPADSATADVQSASASLSVGPVDVTSSTLVVGVFGQDTMNLPNYTPGTGVTELYDLPLNAHVNDGGIFVGYHEASGTGTFTFAVSTVGAATWAGMAYAFSGSDETWILAPKTHDGDDATYNEVSAGIAGDYIIRGLLPDDYRVGRSELLIGFASAGSQTLELEGATAPDFSDAVVLDTVTLTGTGSYTADAVTFTPDGSAGYAFYRISGPPDVRIYTWSLFPAIDADAGAVAADLEAHVVDPTDAHDASAVSYDNGTSGLTADDVQAALDELAAATSGDAELNIEGGQSVIDDDSFPAAGATEDFDPTDGNVFTRTLDDDLAGMILAPVGSGAATLEFWFTQDGSGGHTVTLAASGGSVAGDISAHTLVAGETFRVIADRIPGTTNDWVVDLVGGSGGASALDDLTDVTITTPAENDTLRYVSGEWINDNRRWEPVWDAGELVWDGDDLVMGWSAY